MSEPTRSFVTTLPLLAALTLLAACGQGAAPATDPDTAAPSGVQTSATPTPTPSPAEDSGEAAPRGEAIVFPHGATAVTLEGALPADADKRYTLDAKAGQPATIALDARGAAIAFNVYPPDSGPGGQALFRGTPNKARFEHVLPSDGVYLIQVFRTGAQGDAPAPYSLHLRVDPASDGRHLSGAPAEHPAQAITDYYGALERGDYAEAYRQWAGEGEASGKSIHEFSAGFAHTRHTDVVVGKPGDGEGAAGSLYVTIPVTVNAVQTDGTRQRFTGSYTLRRVNDVPGSSATQRRWHIASADLKRVE